MTASFGFFLIPEEQRYGRNGSALVTRFFLKLSFNPLTFKYDLHIEINGKSFSHMREAIWDF
jgi:hypothetical protein